MFGVVPRIAAGEIGPEALIAIGQSIICMLRCRGLLIDGVCKELIPASWITGRQRIDMFGAMKDDLPTISAGFENLQKDYGGGQILRRYHLCVFVFIDGSGFCSLISEILRHRVSIRCWRLGWISGSA